jgi:hypothetical protein
MEKLEAYFKSTIAAKLVFVAIFLRLPLVFMPENLNGEWAYLFIYLASVVVDSYLWLTLEKYFRRVLKVKSLAPIILTLVGFMLFQYVLAFQGVNVLIPDWLFELGVIGEAGLFCVTALYIWSINGYEIPHQRSFSILLFLIHFSQISFLIFNGYPWHGVQLLISVTLFALELLIAFYLFQIFNWIGNYQSGEAEVEKLIKKIGTKKL